MEINRQIACQFGKFDVNPWYFIEITCTPTTVVLAGREAVDYIEGSTTAENLVELYDKYFEKK